VRISVAMCTYNGGRYVREQLESIAAQSRRPDELVVCDDRSTDDTAEVVREFASRAPFRVRLHVNESNLGSTGNFEKAISLCGGDIVALSDQDDHWMPEKLARTEAALAAEPGVGMVFSDAEVVDDSLRPLGYTVWQHVAFGPEERRSVRGGGAFDLFLMRNVVAGAAMAFRSRFKELILPIPDDFNLTRDGRILLHDGWAALLISAVAGVALIDEPLMKYRQHPKQQVGAADAADAGAAGLRAAASRQNFFAAEIGQLVAVRERLVAQVPAADRGGAVAKLDSKIAHLRARAGMPRRRSRRLPSVLREMLTLRYHLYSNGARSAAKDLFGR
jgi:glycosyltransferase involved in cell wall biosynthesis